MIISKVTPTCRNLGYKFNKVIIILTTEFFAFQKDNLIINKTFRILKIDKQLTN